MMSTADKLLISILKYDDSTLLFRIKDEWLDSSELPKLRYILDYIGKHDELVGIKTFCDEFSLNRKEVDSRPGVYFRSVKERYIFAKIADDIPTIIRNAKKDVKGSLNKLTELVSHLNNDEDTDSIDTHYSESAATRIEKYKERVLNKGIMYLSMGHPVLDEVFSGYGKTSLVTIGGRAGSKKTFLVCFLALLADAILPEDFGPIMFLSNEMSTDEILDRMDAIRFHLPFSEFLKGKLTRQQFKRYEKGISLLESSRIIFLENVYTMHEYNNKLRIYRPSLSFIDGSYLMEPEYKGDDWKRITYITRYLKRIHKTMSIPCTNTTQLKRATGKGQSHTSFNAQDDFAYASSYTQDSDIAIRMFADKEMMFRSEVGMEVAKGRNIDGTQIPVFVANMVKMDFHFLLVDANGEEVVSVDTTNNTTNSSNTKVKW